MVAIGFAIGLTTVVTSLTLGVRRLSQSAEHSANAERSQAEAEKNLAEARKADAEARKTHAEAAWIEEQLRKEIHLRTKALDSASSMSQAMELVAGAADMPPGAMQRRPEKGYAEAMIQPTAASMRSLAKYDLNLYVDEGNEGQRPSG